MTPIENAGAAIRASSRGDVRALSELPHEALLVTDERGSSALHWAAGSGHLECVRHLLTLGINADTLEIPPGPGRTRGISQRTPLHFAARNGHLAVVTFLCSLTGRSGSKAAVQPDHRASDGVSPYQHACWQNHLPVARYLVEKAGVDPSQVNSFQCGAQHWIGLSPRHRAGKDGVALLPLVTWLDEVGVDWARPQLQGHTPLHKAAHGGQIAVCQWLRERHGMLDDVQDIAGNFAADVADMARQAETAAWLRKHCSPTRAKAAKLLGVPYAVEWNDPALRKIYRQLALRTHPDGCQSRDVTAKPDTCGNGTVGADFKDIDRAYKVLSAMPGTAAARQQEQRNSTHTAIPLLSLDGTTVNSTKSDHPDDVLGTFKSRLAIVLSEWKDVKNGGGGMPLGLLPKKYEQLWGPLPASSSLGLKQNLGLLQVLRNFQDIVAIHQSRGGGAVTIWPRHS